VIAARVNGELRDLAYPLAAGDVVEPVRAGSPEGRSILRHSTAHVLAQAVQQLFPDAKLGIGPPVEHGFYYDFDVAEPFGPDDLKAIEQRMRQIVKQGQRFSRRVVSPDEARAELALEPYKLELIGLKGPTGEESVEVGGHELTMYDNLDRRTGQAVWTDLCRGPHLPTTRDIPAFRLMRTGGAYWRGSERNPQLQRIYGTAWESREAQGSTCTCSRRPSGATTGGWAPSWTCSRSRRRSAAGCPSSTPRVAPSAGSWKSTRGSGTSRPATSS
jgi:threonyl-tRNA synthetase